MIAVWALGWLETVQCAQSKALSKQDMVALIELGIDEATIVSKINTAGISSSLNTAILDELQAKGAKRWSSPRSRRPAPSLERMRSRSRSWVTRTSRGS
jgi:hypothetical protein